MPMSLKCMIDKWLHKGQISQTEYDFVMRKLKGHDKQIRAEAIDDCIQWIVSKFSYIDELNVPRIRCNASTIEINMREQLMQKGTENE